MVRQSIFWKLVGLLLVGGAVSIALLAALAVQVGRAVLSEHEMAALETVRSSRHHYIEKYFRIIRDQTLASCQARLITEATVELGAALRIYS